MNDEFSKGWKIFGLRFQTLEKFRTKFQRLEEKVPKLGNLAAPRGYSGTL